MSRRTVLALALVALTAPGRALAQPASAPQPPAPVEPPTPQAPPPGDVPQPEPGPSAEALAEAKRLFFQGNELLQAGDCQRALGYFLDSRALVPSIANTLNAAVCLTRLARADEALEMYEALLTGFRDTLEASDRETIGPEMSRLRGLVGELDVSADTDGQLVVDGRPRGRLPRITPLRVLPGSHEVIVLKEGFASSVSQVDIAVGKTTRLSATLEPLRLAGKLRVEGDGLAGATLWIDGAPLGVAPWQGSLAPGEHSYWLTKGTTGSAPESVTIVKGQTALVTPSLAPVGPELTLTTAPETARLSLDGVFVGAGRWRGKLPLGPHRATASEPGYRALAQTIRVQSGGPTEARLELVVDPAHPRWGAKPARIGALWIEVFGGAALGATLGSGAERACAQDGAIRCDEASLAAGPQVGLRAGFELPVRVSFELAGGYLHATQRLTRSFDGTFADDVAVHYAIDDALALTGPFAAVGAGYRAPLAGPLDLRLHLLLGVLFARSWDDASGALTSGGRSAAALIERAGQATTAPDLFVAPEADLGLRFGGFRAGLGLALEVMTLEGPAGAIGQVFPEGAARCKDSSVECAPGSAAIAAEQTFRPFLLFTPTATLGYSFEL